MPVLDSDLPLAGGPGPLNLKLKATGHSHRDSEADSESTFESESSIQLPHASGAGGPAGLGHPASGTGRHATMLAETDSLARVDVVQLVVSYVSC